MNAQQASTVATPATVPGVQIELLTVSGPSADGIGEVTNNVWIIGAEANCVVFDAPHRAGPILGAIAGRRLVGILCTHAHQNHIGALEELRAATGAMAYLHVDDRPLWDETVPEPAEMELSDGDELTSHGVTLKVMHTPGHAPGACCFYTPELKVLFSGDTLIKGGPGPAVRNSRMELLVDSIEERLLTLPPDTLVLPGHGEVTTIGAEIANRAKWLLPVG